MTLLSCKCPNCGAIIKFDSNSKKGFCEHCKNEYIMEDIVNNYQTITQYNTTQYVNKNIYGNDNLEYSELIKNGDVFLSLNEYTKAEKVYNKAIELNPADWKGWFGLVKVKTKNFTDYFDTTHLEYLNKARKVANEEQLKELNELYKNYINNIHNIQAENKIYKQQEFSDNENRINYKSKTKVSFIKILFIIFLIITIVGFCCYFIIPKNSDQPETSVLDFETIQNLDKTLTITQYLSSNTTVNIPSEINGETITAIGENVFKDNNTVEEIIIPSTITSIGNFAFLGTKNLKIIRIESQVPPLLGENVFIEYIESAIICLDLKIIVPDSSYETYIKTWSLYSDNIYSKSNPDLKRVIFTVYFNYMYDDIINTYKEDTYVKETENISVMVRLPTPTRTGYNFDGWYTDSNYTSVALYDTIYQNRSEDIYLYAKWTGNQVYLIFDSNGSTSGIMENKLITIGTTYILPENKYERNGYTFVGWTQEKSSNNIIADKGTFTASATIKEVITLYAKWAKSIYTYEDLDTIYENNTCFYTLNNNLDLTNKKFTSIQKFYGIFNGNGFQIKNSSNPIFIENYGEILNLQITNCSPSILSNNSDNSSYVGGFIALNKGKIKNSLFVGEFSSNNGSNVGGFCGVNFGNIEASKAELNITAITGKIGGFVGSSSGSLLNCYANGSLNVEKVYYNSLYVGGFIGEIMPMSTIMNCYSNIIINGSGNNIGGFTAWNQSSSTVIKNCFAVGKINAVSDKIGGFSSCSMPSTAINLFRSDNNLFSEGDIYRDGALIELNKFYSKQFYIDNNIFDSYINDENLELNSNSVWVLNNNELPVLHWESI